MSTNYFTVDYKIKEIAPKSKDLINIYFHPQKCEKYNEEIIFFVNSQEVRTKITGEGVKIHVYLEDATNKCVDLGSPMVGQKIKKVIRVINKSPATVNAIFDIWDNLPYYKFPPIPETHYLDPPLKKPEEEG